MAGFGVRGIEVVKSKSGARISLDPVWYTASASRDRAVCPGMFGVMETDGTVDGCRGVNDTTNGGSGAKLIKGLIAQVADEKGRILDNQYVGTATACKVRFYANPGDIIYRASEDGAGGALTSYTVGSCPIADTAPSSTETTETHTPNPEANDKLDSSGYHATVTQHACRLLGKDPDVRNVDNGTTQVVLFTLNSAYLA